MSKISAKWAIGLPVIILAFVLPWQVWLIVFAMGVVAAYFWNRHAGLHHREPSLPPMPAPYETKHM
jgi:hypothetical protein